MRAEPSDAASIVPPKKFRVLHLFSGPGDNHPDATTLKGLVEKIAREQVNPRLHLECYEIDYANCGCTDDNGRAADEYCSLTHD